MAYKPGMGTLLRGLVYQLDKDIDATYEAAGIPFRARFYPIYRYVSEVGTCPMRDLVATTGTSFSAVSQTIRQMEQLGLIDLETGTDRRVKTVSLSRKAEEIRPQLEAIWDRVETAHKELDQEMGINTREVLQKFTKALGRKSLIERIQHRDS
jgi:DNA-binding MarR family transcriptional regulator